MSVHRRRVYDADFKRNAVRLSEDPGISITQLAKELGISRSMLYNWRAAFKAKGELAFPSHGKEGLSQEEQKIRQLEKRLRDAEQERDI